MALAKAEFTISIRPIDSLCPHEEVIPAHVKRLAAEIAKDGVQRDPIIIDRDSAAILDGMHRLAAFRALGVGNAVCCALDYSSKGVTLGRWARVYARDGGGTLEDAIPMAAKLKRTSLAQAFDSLDRREAGFALLTSDSAFLSGPESSFPETTHAIKEIDQLAAHKSWGRTFVPEDEVDVPLQDPRALVVLPRRITKDDVVAAARRGVLFPCKTSMHVIDPRPVAVDFPISELDKATTEALRERLKAKEGFLAPPNTEYRGRRYKERLLFLDRR